MQKYYGTTDINVTERELENSSIARKAAAQGIVLLENNGVLPLANGTKIALYGFGARHTIKGGTGSGDVNERRAINIEQGLLDAGYDIVSTNWLNDFDEVYSQAKLQWKTSVESLAQSENIELSDAFFRIPFVLPEGRELTEIDIIEDRAEVAIFAISRVAGEFFDRKLSKGDWYLSDYEHEMLSKLSKSYEEVIVLINSGGMIDLSFLEEFQISSLIYLTQAGMEGGHAFADIVSGSVSPSGKLTDTWAYQYTDYPSSEHFSHIDGDVAKSLYEEGIYVGYRYFDSFDIKPRYEFGYGLSFTEFDYTIDYVKVEESSIHIGTKVKNIGNFIGKEVLQLYVSPPSGSLPKEYQRLMCFQKTGDLAPGEEVSLELVFALEECASYFEGEAAFILEKGDYILRVGTSSRKTTPVKILQLEETVVTEKLVNICPLKTQLSEIQAPVRKEEDVTGLSIISIPSNSIPMKSITYGKDDLEKEEYSKAKSIADMLTDDELLYMVCGRLSKGTGVVGMNESRVAGSAGETCSLLVDKYGVNSIVLADGPAGIRLQQTYHISGDGTIQQPKWIETIDKGFFAKDFDDSYTKYYQFCTAFPIGTLLAQTWDTKVVEEVGEAVAREMIEFGITLWLAPGMNIHRNPLCGRNFEYFSEDPLITGKMAAAITKGVQSESGCGTTIKHFTCNNQEENRQHCDSIVSERSLREIYLKGFEIAIKSSNPMSVMTSYNLINGIHAANCYDTITKVLRDEWGFQGMVMTDWWTTGIGGSSSYGCITAGNDLIMPGMITDIEEMQQALNDNSLTQNDLKKCATRIIRTVLSA